MQEPRYARDLSHEAGRPDKAGGHVRNFLRKKLGRMVSGVVLWSMMTVVAFLIMNGEMARSPEGWAAEQIGILLFISGVIFAGAMIGAIFGTPAPWIYARRGLMEAVSKHNRNDFELNDYGVRYDPNDDR